MDQENNVKAKRSLHTFNITVRDKAHFDKLIIWLNQNVGRGANSWSMEGRILKTLKRGKPITTQIYIFNPEIEKDVALFLTLL